jgi:two-component sensor histidine kinase
LCASIRASMIDDTNRVSLVSTVDDTVTDANVSVSLGLIVTELVINALKHALPGRSRKVQIEVHYSSSELGWTLTMGDNGKGMDAEADSKPGLGTGIVEGAGQAVGRHGRRCRPKAWNGR